MKNITKYALLHFVFSNSYFVLANYGLILFLLKRPLGSIFPLYHTFSWFDYNTYLSVITQGKYGYWLMRDAFTTEATNPTLFYFFYILVGKAAAIFHIDSFIAYHIARLIGVQTFIIGLYVVSRKILGTKLGTLASLLTVVLTIPPVVFFDEPGAGSMYTPWWASLESLKRLDVMPHYLFGYSFLFLCFYSVGTYLEVQKVKYALLAICAAFCGCILFPPSALPIVFSLPLAYIIRYKKDVISKNNIKRSIVIFSILLITCIGMLLIWKENANGFPWDTWNTFEVSTYNNASTDRGMLVVFSIFPYISLLSIFHIFSKKNFMLLLLFFWGCIPFVFTHVADVLHISKYRLVTTAPFVPYAILTVFVLFQIIPNIIASKYKFMVFILIFISQMYLTIKTIPQGISDVLQFPKYRIMFIPIENWEGIQYVKNTIPKGKHILSDQYNGSILPAHAPVVSYVGHFVHTKEQERKLLEVRDFFSQTMDADSAWNLIKNGSIDYVYFGYDEKQYGMQELHYPFLQLLFSNKEVAIYKVTYD